MATDASETRYTASAYGYATWAEEPTPYEKQDAVAEHNHFGLLDDEIDFPNENPHTALPGGSPGRRGPHVNSPDPREYNFDVNFTVLDDRAPLEFALGQRTVTGVDTNADGTDEYTEHMFTEAPVLPTFTLQHQQEDLGLIEWFVGCKSDLTLSASSGEELQAAMSITAAGSDYDDAPASGDFVDDADLEIPEKAPFVFEHLGDVSMGADVVATINSFSLGWSNGLEANHHGDGRDAYSVKETTAADKYDMSITINVVDTAAYKRAKDNQEPVDVEIPLYRDGGPDYNDALFVRLKNCTIVDAPVGRPAEGDIESEIGIMPTDTEIEIRTPN